MAEKDRRMRIRDRLMRLWLCE